MGICGQAPTPAKILKARGSWRAKGREQTEVHYEAGAPSCPAWLTKEAKAEWRRQVRQLTLAGVIEQADRAVLAAYCEAWSEFVTASRTLERDGYTTVTAKGRPMPSPWTTVKNHAATRLVKLAAHFGFSPAARTRVKAGAKASDGEGAGGKARFFSA
jgi:P27 family predicted phage terminase small subunit